MTYARRTWIVLWKDLLSERRSKETLNALFFFALLLLFLFQFALGADRERLTAAMPGLLWLGFILSGLVGLGRAFLAERELEEEEEEQCEEEERVQRLLGAPFAEEILPQHDPGAARVAHAPSSAWSS